MLKMGDDDIKKLEFAYKIYPRKEGKLAGFKRLQKNIKTRDEIDQLVQAVKNYAELCKIEGREKCYIKMWSTFCTNWQDYVEADDLGLADFEPMVIE